jgi:hypothetical protein
MRLRNLCAFSVLLSPIARCALVDLTKANRRDPLPDLPGVSYCTPKVGVIDIDHLLQIGLALALKVETLCLTTPKV